jgi:hypothetical protein
MSDQVTTSEEYILTDNEPPLPPPKPEEVQKEVIIGLSVVLVLLVAGLIASIVYLAQPTTDTAKIRDIFIILLGFQSILTGFVMIIMVIQLARLINLLNNEIKPILETTNETISHLRGTTVFLSENLSEPVVKLNGYIAGMTEFLRLIGIVRRPPKL